MLSHRFKPTVLSKLLPNEPLFQAMPRIKQDPVLHGGLRASAITGRFVLSITSNRTTAFFGKSAPRQRRGRKAAIAVSASTSEPIGKIGPCAL